ncbi:MAG: uncharacterized protein KVP18_004856 [Porospora cf. gigantea A]|nr:MAG: hypothetical protein KVP18_004856 [Porospora cf. gigantea A]
MKKEQLKYARSHEAEEVNSDIQEELSKALGAKWVADLYEALIGATLLEAGFDLRAVWAVIARDFEPFEDVLGVMSTDEKFMLSVSAQKTREEKIRIGAESREGDALRTNGNRFHD